MGLFALLLSNNFFNKTQITQIFAESLFVPLTLSQSLRNPRNLRLNLTDSE